MTECWYTDLSKMPFKGALSTMTATRVRCACDAINLHRTRSPILVLRLRCACDVAMKEWTVFICAAEALLWIDNHYIAALLQLMMGLSVRIERHLYWINDAKCIHLLRGTLLHFSAISCSDNLCSSQKLSPLPLLMTAAAMLNTVR